MDIFSSLTQLLLAIGLVINTLLAFIVYRDDRKSATNIIFIFLCLATSLWLIVIHKASTPSTHSMTLWYTRFTVFLAVPQSVLFFLLAHTLPSKAILLKKRSFILLLMSMVVMMCITLSPLVFKAVTIQGDTIKSIPGIGIPLFALYTILFSIAAIYVLIKKIRGTNDIIKQQLVYMMTGILLMLGLIIGTIMVPIILFQNQIFIPFAPVYVLIFFGMTAYAIVKFHLFNIKTIATEAFTVVLLVVFLSRAFVATSASDRIVSIIIFAATVLFGVLLIRSVRNEIAQRERLQVITAELEKANAQLKQLDQARADFITLTSHQLRTPPATIKWYLAAIKSGDFGVLPTDIVEPLTKAEITNNALISLIDDLLNASRIERGKMEFLFEPVALDELAKFTVEQLTPQAQMKGLTLTYEPATTPVPGIVADKEKIRQVINNFIDNAIKYTPKGSIVTRVLVDSEYVSIEVEDTGKGMQTDTIPTLFGKYNRGKDSVTHATGIGIGLYVAKIVVENHKGLLGARSAGAGKGSVFYFRIPIKNNLPHTKVMDLVAEQSNVTQ